MIEVKTANVGSIKMKYASFGCGEGRLVIIPGLSVKNTTENADAVMKAYSKYLDRYTFYIVDRRESVPDNYSVYDMADDTAAVMRHLKIGKADIFGASQGGIIAMLIAAKYPEIVKKTVAASSVAKNNGTVIDEWIYFARKRDRKALAESFTEKIYSEKMQKLYKNAILAEASTYTDAELDRFIVMSDAITHFDITDSIKNLHCPSLVIASEGDMVFEAETTKSLAAVTKSGLFVYPDEYGHAVYDEAPDFTDRVMEFFMANSEGLIQKS